MLNQMNYLNLIDRTEKRLTQHTAAISSSKLAVKLKRKIVFIDTAELIAVEAQGNYVLLRREFSSYRLRESISGVAEELMPHGLIRIHRSVLVNPSFVEEMERRSNGEYSLRVRGAKEYRVSRTYKGNLRLIAQFWIGTGSSPLDN